MSVRSALGSSRVSPWRMRLRESPRGLVLVSTSVFAALMVIEGLWIEDYPLAHAIRAALVTGAVFVAISFWLVHREPRS
jgi:hypothetical protein